VIIGDGVITIGEYAFFACSGLTSVIIGDSVTTIESSAFSSCSSLVSFTVAADNTAYASQDGILYNKAKTTIILVPQAISGAATLPDTLTSIGDRAFYGCSRLTSVTIPDSVTSIGGSTSGGAFYGCSALTSVTIPGSVTTIGESAFRACTKLVSVTVLRETSPLTTLGSGAFDNASNLLKIYMPWAVVTAYNALSGWNYYSIKRQAISA
jgi:hypothetical protein